MGKKKIKKKKGKGGAEKKPPAAPRAPKKKVEFGRLYVESTYNNTKVLLADGKGNALVFSSSGALGFAGAKKGTPFAAAKVGEALGEKAKTMGIKEVEVIVRGVG